MNKNILVIATSLRNGGNSDILADELYPRSERQWI